jgi:predicted MFS family arabinose efflux permease
LGSAPEPLIPLNLFANPVVRNGTIAALFGMGTFIGLSIYVPVYLETVVGLSPGDSGLALIPLMVGTVMGATIAGRVMTKITHYKRLPMIGLSMAFAANAILSWKAGQLPLPALEVLFAMFSIGLGTMLPVTTVSVQNAVSVHQLGTATGGMNFFRSLGGALVVAGFGAILLGGGLEPGPHGPGAHAGTDRAALIQAFSHIYLAAAICIALALFWLMLMKELPLRGSVQRAAHTAE